MLKQALTFFNYYVDSIKVLKNIILISLIERRHMNKYRVNLFFDETKKDLEIIINELLKKVLMNKYHIK